MLQEIIRYSQEKKKNWCIILKREHISVCISELCPVAPKKYFFQFFPIHYRRQRRFISYANAKRAKRCCRGRIWNAERLLVYAKILRLWMKTSWIPASFFIVLRSSADLNIFEFLTVIIYFVTLKKCGFTKSLMQFLTDTSKSFVKTLMVKLRLTDHTSEPYFTKISQSSLVGII